MKLWLLRPIDPDSQESLWQPWYDKTFGFVVRAETPEEARKLTEGHTGDEAYSGDNPWLDSNITICLELTNDGEAKVIMTDFHAA